MTIKKDNKGTGVKKIKRVSFLEYAPHSPGVYIMRRGGKIIYIGKAKDLYKRVSSYFSGEKDIKTAHLVSRIEDIEYIITKTEYEALILENNLIKRWKPRYNICLKDGKSFPVIKITDEEFPAVFKTRYISDDNASYFGPFPGVEVMEKYLDLIKKRFPLRKCRNLLKSKKAPCLYYHIGWCLAPCCGKADRNEYNSYVEKVKTLLSGDPEPLISELTEKMSGYAERREFEKAAVCRDFINAVKELASEQKVQDFDPESRDYIAAVSDNGFTAFVVLQMREGKLTGKSAYVSAVMDLREAATQFFIQYYSAFKNISMGISALPSAIFTNIMPETEHVRKYFSGLDFPAIEISEPESERDAAIIKMASENCKMELYKKNRLLDLHDSLKELQDVLELPALPLRIEGFDISHLGGSKTVASMVSFLNGRPDRSGYRCFHIRSIAEGVIDDYRSIREVVARRYSKVVNDSLEKPDLILVDGGKGQLNAAIHILKTLGLGSIPAAGLAEKNEEIFLPGKSDPVRLPETSGALRILQNVRDESHRFALKFNKNLRKKSLSLSLLESIPGIGKARSKKLITAFGSMEDIADASLYDIAKTAGISQEAAEKCSEYLKNLRKK